MNREREDSLSEFIARIGLDLFPSEVRDEVETLLAPGQSLDPAARARLVDAAKRGVRRWALSLSPLEVLLFERRRDEGKDADEIAQSIDADSDRIRAIERGEQSIKSENSEVVAAWIRVLSLDRVVALTALRRSLRPPVVESASYAGEGEPPLSEEDASFVRRVEAALDPSADSANTHD
jgi:hypothetical protein